LDKPFREATVHHSINGSFAIRKGDWKLIMCPGSGGWSFPRPDDKAALDSLPSIQLYDLAKDPAESTNLQAENPEKVVELKTLLSKYINEGRSTPGLPQQNDEIDFEWTQINFAGQ
jgi:arylsulfatase A-like enzyme